ncbi:MAG: SelT/SelW/SelH family protein [Porticoccaceae bacterium]|nr:SelT/SelW/SelH family protein [Pseudomonadales bacterium]MCP5170890.1 SelT/SelW/SelH family protein [Pseudomonadales bacterium]MCP5301870.1 SelT/SelW/SelH family protein [Pseudomonadales bacterium]
MAQKNISPKPVTEKPGIEIIYCPRCNWLLRSAWMAQELLHTFADDLAAVALVPSSEGGVFEIRLNGDLLWERKSEGGFPDVKALKQRVRDVIDPDRNLGHLER